MFVQIGKYTFNMAAVVAIEWQPDCTFPAIVRLQGAGVWNLTPEETEQFKTALDQLITLEQFVQQTQAAMQQQQEQMIAEMMEKQKQLDAQVTYCNQVKAELDRQANVMAIQKNQGLIKKGGRG